MDNTMVFIVGDGYGQKRQNFVWVDIEMKVIHNGVSLGCVHFVFW